MSQVFSQSPKDSGGQSAEIKFNLVDVTPSPVFSWFDGPYDWMSDSAIVLRRVFILRRVAAAHVTAGHAKPQVHPDVAQLETLFAAPCVGFDILNLIGVCAWIHGLFVTCNSCIAKGPGIPGEGKGCGMSLSL